MRFYTTTQNTRGKEIGTGNSKGQVTHTRGWDLGVKVIACARGEKDCFEVWATGGSHDSSNKKFLGTVRLESGKIVIEGAVG